jgi:hypothetical protein
MLQYRLAANPQSERHAQRIERRLSAPVVPMWHPLRLAEDTSAPIGRITSFSAKFTDAPLAEGKLTPKSRAP